MSGFYRDLKDVKWDKKPYVDTWCSHWPRRSVEHWRQTRNFIWPQSNTCKGALSFHSGLRGETLDLKDVEIGKKLRSALNQTLEGDHRVGKRGKISKTEKISSYTEK